MDRFPYEDLVRVNGQRSRREPEFELIDAMWVSAARLFVCYTLGKGCWLS